MDNIQIVKDYYTAWETCDKSLLKLAEKLIHSSPDGNYSSREEFLNDCWQYAGISNHKNMKIISEGNIVCTRFDAAAPDGRSLPVCEWFTIKDGLIIEIRVFYDRKSG